MKPQKMLIIAAIGCLSVVFLSGSAQAQLQGIINDYCVELAEAAVDAIERVAAGGEDLLGCEEGYGRCLDGIGTPDLARCFRDYSRCVKNASQNQEQGCAELSREFSSDTRRAFREADIQNVEDEFQQWFLGQSSEQPTSSACLGPVQRIDTVCDRISD